MSFFWIKWLCGIGIFFLVLYRSIKQLVHIKEVDLGWIRWAFFFRLMSNLYFKRVAQELQDVNQDLAGKDINAWHPSLRFFNFKNNNNNNGKMKGLEKIKTQ